MKSLSRIGCVLGVAVALLVVVSLRAQPASDKPSIDGNYVLDRRELPDGKVVRPPEVMGMLTLANGRRNFNVYWKQDGKDNSISAISKYKLTAGEFEEENEFYLANDAAGGKGPTCDTEKKSAKAPVTSDGGKLKFKLPLHDEPEVVFDKSGMTATRPGAFVDHWSKVD